MAADLLSLLIKTNLAAAAAILLTLAMRKPARKAFGPRTAYLLWLVVPLAAGASLLPARTVVLPYTAPPEPIADVAASPAFTGAVKATVEAAPLMDGAAFIALWLAGAALSFAFLAWSQSRFIRSLGGVVREGKFLRARACGAGPAVVGALFPRIVLPADFETRYAPAEQKVVLAHEAAHLASGDAAVNAMLALAQCLFWFNPLIHLAARTVRIDQELACDAAVLAAHPSDRRPYAEALLKTQLASTPLPLGCYWPAGASNPLKERIAMLNSQTPSRTRRLGGGILVLVFGLGAGFAAWAVQPATVTSAAAPRAAASPPPIAVKPEGEVELAAETTQTGVRSTMAFASPSGALAQSADQTVPSPEAAKTTGAQRLARFAVVYEVPENLTDEGKARMLSSIDTQIANAPREEMRDLYIRAREALAVRSTNRAGQSSDRQEADAHSIFGRYMKEGWTTTSDAMTITATGLSKDGRPHTMTVRLNTSPSTVDTPPSGGAPEASAAQSILLTGSNPTGTVRVNVSPDGKQSNIYGSSSFIGRIEIEGQTLSIDGETQAQTTSTTIR